ncbi:MAG: hypothetical protein MJZ85_07570 [Bacteroidales bacterium]|nr:hypothetical protein [Bacteroidales bacterium]MCQ2316525.1 hypothetical protein [Bacteroidales bacterium]
MATITLKFNPRNALARKTLDYITSLGVFSIDEKGKSPYNPDFVEKIRKSETEPSETLNLEKYGIKV